ncbi:Pls/PosA family non-ribosomal peptide synthetase [Streptomyces sp. NPDC052016]|uniref:Pls/PosA family non-ribosomal peptide synthetase n=1 Tax=Streptomyces sp. NPDC052016 TaxID=3365680 RepID=UPI0037D681B4
MEGKPVEALTADPDPSIALSGHTDPASGIETILTEVLSGVLRVDDVPPDSHFFDELGADSLLMAQFCARVRKRPDLPSISMKDVYRHPTIRSLTAALERTSPSPDGPPIPAPVETERPARPAGGLQHIFCGTLQFLAFLGWSFAAALVAVAGFNWVYRGTGLIDIYLRAVLFGGVAFLALCLLPIVAKWTLIGRWKPRQIRVWSLAYFRFWVVRTLLRSSPLLLFAGSPLHVLHLRALGAHVGRGAAVLSRNIPICTDLLTIGAGTVIRKDSLFSCYRAHDGLIQTGTVTIGSDAFVGEATVLDIGTSLGDGAQLGHSSSLHSGQAVPAGERWHGSPAQPTETDYRTVGPVECGTARKVLFTVAQVLGTLFLYLPLAVGGVTLLLSVIPNPTALADGQSPAFTGWAFYLDALAVSFVGFFGSALVGLLLVVTVPRALHLAIEPDRVYRLYGFHYGVHRAIERLTNRKFFKVLFGDSSWIVHYLRGIGYDLSRVEQTGSNFGTEMKHDTPFLTKVGSGTMVADGLSVINADFSSTSFRVSRVSIGPRNFLGNRIHYPVQGRTGDNCLLATKVMVPIDGPLREGVGLLGSPCFEIPRSVERDSRFDHLKTDDELSRHLAAKDKHNAATLGLFLLTRWIHVLGVVLIASGASGLYPSLGASVVALASVAALLFSVVYFVLLERVATKFRPLRPLYCSIYDTAFWRHERYWKLTAMTERIALFNGTPFKSLVWRLLGVRLGKRVFDDGCFMPERTLVTIGDDCTLNAGTVIQCHSQEDGTFKSDHSTIGSGCTLGVGAFIHYGVTIGDGAVLAPDSFLMKGEEIPPRARWGGNPAREMRSEAAEPRVLRDGDDSGRGVLVGGEQQRGNGKSSGEK